mgnify:CR=1 FL=1
MTVCRQFIFLFTLIPAFNAAVVQATHPLSISRTLVDLRAGRATITVDVFLEDLYLFHNLKQNQAGRIPPDEIQRGINRHLKFVADRFLIRSADGKVLSPRSSPSVRFDIPADGAAVDQLMKHRLTFEFMVAFDKSDAVLTFEQTFSGPGQVLPAEMQLTVIQDGGGLLFEGQLEEEKPRTIRFDPRQPPPAQDATDDARSRWIAKRDEAAFGITSFSSVYAFLYQEPEQTRLEVLMPLSTLNDAVPLERNQPATLTVPEQDALRPEIIQWFKEGIRLTSDDSLIAPVTDRCDIYGADLTDFAYRPQPEDVAFASGRLGLILKWNIPPEESGLTLTWNCFSNSFRGVRLIVIDDQHEDPIRRVSLTQTGNRNTWSWRYDGAAIPHPVSVQAPEPWYHETRIPTLSGAMVVCALLLSAMKQLKSWQRLTGTLGFLAAALILIGAPGRIVLPYGKLQLSDDEFQTAVTSVLSQTYSSFALPDEERIYDALAVTTDAELSQEIFLEMVDGIREQSDGGAIATVEDVSVVSTTLSPTTDAPPGTLAGRVEWVVSGTIEHWGHIHSRRNRFVGDVQLKWSGDRWQLTNVKVADHSQVNSEIKLRRVTGAAVSLP